MLSDTRNARPVLSLSGLVLFAFSSSRKLRFLGRFSAVCETLILERWQGFTLRYPQLTNRAQVKSMSTAEEHCEKNTCPVVEKSGDNVNDSSPKTAKIEKPYSGHCAPASRARASLTPSSLEKELKVYIFNSSRSFAGGSLLLLVSALCEALFDNCSQPRLLPVCDWSQSNRAAA